ncbi:MAG: hypothetical protein IOC54_14310 [Methylobacterium sp.]|jgi:hypothetical protein|nr:hypothetical protein [Methylobacterium sp.]MCA3652994.1 hypothetical protein [Methylobacterium sp.]
MRSPIADSWFIAIKQATRDLVLASRGVVAAGEVAHASRSEVSRWQCATDPDIIPLAAVLALEAECGQPLVTGAMARLHGMRLSGEAPSSAAAIAASHAQIMQHFARLMQDMAHALADGQITPSEAGSLRRLGGDVMRGVNELCSQLEAAQAGVVRRPLPRGLDDGA